MKMNVLCWKGNPLKNIVRLIAVVCVAVLAGAGVTFAQTADVTATSTFTIQPGGKATISYEAFCLDFGPKFPATVKAPNCVVAPEVQNAMYYALTKGYQSSQPLELQYAIWELRGAQNTPKSGATAAEIKAATTTAPALAGTSVLDAVRDNKVKLTLDSWEPIGDKVNLGGASDHFYGKGQLTLENTLQESLTLAMPVGTIFQTPDSSSQNMASYATAVQVNNPASQLPQTGALDSNPSLLALAAGVYFILAALGIKRFLRSHS